MTVEITETRNPPATVAEHIEIAAASEVDDNSAGDDQPSVASTQETEDGGDAHPLDTGSASASVHADEDDHAEERDIDEGTPDQEDHDDHQDDRVDPEDHKTEGQHGQIDHESSQNEQPVQMDVEVHRRGDDDSREDDGGSTVEEEQPQTRTSGRRQRPRKKPRWMQTGEFALQQQTIGHSDWRARADYLANLAKSGILDRNDSSVSSALISIGMGTQK